MPRLQTSSPKHSQFAHLCSNAVRIRSWSDATLRTPALSQTPTQLRSQTASAVAAESVHAVRISHFDISLLVRHARLTPEDAWQFPASVPLRKTNCHVPSRNTCIISKLEWTLPRMERSMRQTPKAMHAFRYIPASACQRSPLTTRPCSTTKWCACQPYSQESSRQSFKKN